MTFKSILLISIFILTSCRDKTPLILNEGEIYNDLHKNHVGQIAFMGNWIPFDEFDQDDFVTQLEITKNSDFGFRMFLDKTLTYYLSQLEPDLTVEELCTNGNFQLRFYLDGKQVYEDNVQPGAGSCDYKNSATVYGVPFVHKDNPDHWGRFLWTKFMRQEGGQNLLSNGTHSFKVEVRPYVKHEILKIGEVIASGEVDLHIVEDKIDEDQLAIQQIEPTNRWAISQISYDTSIIRKLNKRIAQNYFKNISSVVVIKDGKLLIEEYFNDSNRETFHDTRSVGKTLASTLLGIAIDQNYVKGESQTLTDFYNIQEFNNYSQDKERVTLKSLLTMSSGLVGSDSDPDSPGNEENMYPTDDWVKFGLDLPMDKNKKMGLDWEYFTAGAVILGDIINKTVPEGMEQFADKKLFAPLGIKNYRWQYTPTGIPNTAGGFQMSSLDYAAYGQLYLDIGKKDGQQIVSHDWIQSSMKKHIAIPDREEEYYGYLLWNKSYDVEGAAYEAFYASGNGGNRIMIFNSINAVIVITATAYGQPYMHAQVDEIINDYILPAIKF